LLYQGAGLNDAAAHLFVLLDSVIMNITLSLDDELIGAAKSLAAKHGTSMTALVRMALERQVAIDLEVNASGVSGALQALSDYSLGRIPRRAAMEQLGLLDDGQLLGLLNQAGLPHPVVPISVRRQMAQQMVSALRGAGVVASAKCHPFGSFCPTPAHSSRWRVVVSWACCWHSRTAFESSSPKLSSTSQHIVGLTCPMRGKSRTFCWPTKSGSK
jgi:plasmid stability protein